MFNFHKKQKIIINDLKSIDFKKEELENTTVLSSNIKILQFIVEFPLKKENINNKLLLNSNLKKLLETKYGKAKKVRFSLLNHVWCFNIKGNYNVFVFCNSEGTSYEINTTYEDLINNKKLEKEILLFLENLYKDLVSVKPENHIDFYPEMF